MHPLATAWLGQTWIGRFDAPGVPATPPRTRQTGNYMAVLQQNLQLTFIARVTLWPGPFGRRQGRDTTQFSLTASNGAQLYFNV